MLVVGGPTAAIVASAPSGRKNNEQARGLAAVLLVVSNLTAAIVAAAPSGCYEEGHVRNIAAVLLAVGCRAATIVAVTPSGSNNNEHARGIAAVLLMLGSTAAAMVAFAAGGNKNEEYAASPPCCWWSAAPPLQWSPPLTASARTRSTWHRRLADAGWRPRRCNGRRRPRRQQERGVRSIAAVLLVVGCPTATMVATAHSSSQYAEQATSPSCCWWSAPPPSQWSPPPPSTARTRSMGHCRRAAGVRRSHRLNGRCHPRQHREPKSASLGVQGRHRRPRRRNGRHRSRQQPERRAYSVAAELLVVGAPAVSMVVAAPDDSTNEEHAALPLCYWWSAAPTPQASLPRTAAVRTRSTHAASPPCCWRWSAAQPPQWSLLPLGAARTRGMHAASPCCWCSAVPSPKFPVRLLAAAEISAAPIAANKARQRTQHRHYARSVVWLLPPPCKTAGQRCRKYLLAWAGSRWPLVANLSKPARPDRLNSGATASGPAMRSSLPTTMVAATIGSGKN